MARMRDGPGAVAGIGIPGHRKRATAGSYRILVVSYAVRKGTLKVKGLA